MTWKQFKEIPPTFTNYYAVKDEDEIRCAVCGNDGRGPDDKPFVFVIVANPAGKLMIDARCDQHPPPRKWKREFIDGKWADGFRN